MAQATTTLINLQSLFDLSATLNSSDDVGYILNASLLSLMGKLRTNQACALVPDGADRWKPVVSKGRNGLTSSVHLSKEEFDGLAEGKGGVAALEGTDYELCLPLTYSGRPLGVLLLGKNLAGTAYTPEEAQYASLVGTIAANALENADNVRSLVESKRYVERKNQLLTTLFEISKEFTTLLDVERILKLLTYRLMGQLTISRFSLLSKASDGVFTIALNRLKIEPQAADLQAISTLTEITTRSDMSEAIASFAVEAEVQLIVPMRSHNDIRGYLLVGGKLNRQPLTEEDENFLEALASIVLAALENARLFKEELARKSLEEELNLAFTIQQNLLPKTLPAYPTFDIGAMNIPSKHIGGDYYDVIPLSEDELLLVIADVSGKGAPAALLMANTQAALRALAPLRLTLPEMTARINDLLYANTSLDKFVTFFCGRLHVPTQQLIYTNAGHNPPILLRRDGTPELLTEGGIILGIMESMIPYQEASVAIECGDVLLMFTDGVSEALDKDRNEFTDARLEQALATHRDQPASILLSNILLDVQTHAYGAEQSDDITMLVVRCLDEQG